MAPGWPYVQYETSLPALRYQTKARTSPPTLRLRACRSVSNPWDVEMIATPSPPSTRGRSVDFAYTRRPGLDTRLMPDRLRSRFGPNFRSITSVRPTTPSGG